MRRAFLLLGAVLALVATTVALADGSYDLDERALLAELNGTPLPAHSALLSLEDLPAESLALLEADAKESIEAAEVLQMAKPTSAAPAAAAAAAPAGASTKAAESVKLAEENGDVSLGVDFWTVNSARGVYTEPKGTIIGNIPADAELVIEHYSFDKRVDKNGKDDKTQWGYGYVTKPEGFGGWAGENACGWFPLQRVSARVEQNGVRKSNLPNHPTKCPEVKVAAETLQRSKLFKDGSYVADGRIVAAVTKKVCPAFLNYDPSAQVPSGPAPALEAGTFSGKKALGSVPSGFAQKKKVSGFGVQYVTKDGKYAMVKYPRLDPANKGYSHFFVDCECLEFDIKAVAIANTILRADAAKKGAKTIAKQIAKEAAEKKKAEKEAKAAAKKAEKEKKKAEKKAEKAPTKPAPVAPAAPKGGAGGVIGKNSIAPKPAALIEMYSEGDSEAEAEAEGEQYASAESGADAFTEGEVYGDAQLESEDYLPEESPALMEMGAQAQSTVSVAEELSNPSPRGNYPGWTAMLEEQAFAAPAPAAPAQAAPVVAQQAAPAPAAPALAPAPLAAKPAVPAPPAVAAPPSPPKESGLRIPRPPMRFEVPKEGPNVRHVRLGVGNAAATLRNAGVGISKVHVHVYGKADPDVDHERRLQGMVRRLANRQSESYEKINAIIKKLKACPAKEKDCLEKMTAKLEDWKAEWVAPK